MDKLICMTVAKSMGNQFFAGAEYEYWKDFGPHGAAVTSTTVFFLDENMRVYDTDIRGERHMLAQFKEM